MLAFSTLGVTGFVNQPFLPISRPDVPLGVLLRQSGPPTKRMVPCLCTSGRVGGRIGARSEWLKPTDRSKERVKRFGRVQKALAVLIPAVVLATACVSPIPSRGRQQVHLQQRSKEGGLTELGSLSSSVNYPGSRMDVANARSYYVEHPKWHTNLNGQLDTIRAKEEVHRNLQGGRWTYPGWRAEAARGFDAGRGRLLLAEVPLDPDAKRRAIRRMVQSMDTEQEVHEKVPARMPASVWRSAYSVLSYAFRGWCWDAELVKIHFLFAFNPFLLSMPPFCFPQALAFSARYVIAVALGGSLIWALMTSSAIGFIPFVFVSTFLLLLYVFWAPAPPVPPEGVGNARRSDAEDEN